MYESRKGLLSVDASKWCLLLVFSWHHAFAIATCFFWYGCVVFSFFWGTMINVIFTTLPLSVSNIRHHNIFYVWICEVRSSLSDHIHKEPCFSLSCTCTAVSHGFQGTPTSHHQFPTRIPGTCSSSTLLSLSLSGDFRSGTTSVWGIHCYAV